MMRFLPFLAGSVMVHGVVLLCCGAIPIEAVDPGLDQHPSECVYVTLQAPAPDTAVEPAPASEAAPASAPSSSSAGEPVAEKETTTERPPEDPIEPPLEKPMDEPVEERAEPTQTNAILSEEPVRESSPESPEPTLADASPEPPKRAVLALESETPEYTVTTRSDWNRADPTSNKESRSEDAEPESLEESPRLEEETPLESEPTAETKPAEEQAETVKPPSEASGRPTPESAPQVASAATQFHAGSGEDMLHFRDRVLDSIRRSIYFPREAWKEKKHGEATVAFAIGRDGGVLGVDIISSSGHPSLDEAALKIVLKAEEGFPPIPSSCRQESIRYVVPIVFKRTRSEKSK